MSNVFGSCVDLHATWEKGVDENGCPIVTFSSNVEGQESCDVAMGPFLKEVVVNGTSMNVTDLLADINVTYVPYDPAVHVPGPLAGTGTAADPLQVPVKECNFEYVPYDPAVHDAGAVEGDGKAATPWQIPVKECNFEFIAYDPAVHIEGQPIEGDGTVASPWLIPVKEDQDNFQFVAYDSTVHVAGEPLQGAGTPEEPWLVPVKECNFEYVPFDPTVHAAGDIEGAGTAGAPWQIPIFMPEHNFIYVPYDPAIHGDTPDVEGSGTEGDPWQIPLVIKECNFEYVPYDPAVHDAGVIEGDGTAGTPWQVPLPPEVEPKECEFEYVPYDPAVHDAGNIEGDGTAGNPWQIPLVPPAEGTAFVDKLGQSISGGALLLATDFAAGSVAAGDLLLAQDAAGNCKLIPSKECNFEYVPYDEALHASGTIEGDGTAGSPWQIPIFTPGAPAELNIEYVPFDEAVHTAGTIEGDGTEANPFQMPLLPAPLKKDNSVYDGPYQPLNVAGLQDLDRVADTVVGDKLIGQTASEDCVLFDPKPCNFEYVDFDPAIHGDIYSGDSAIVGDGSAGDPWQIPRPCCEPPPCDDIIVTSDLPPDVLLSGCTQQATTRDITVEEIGRGHYGYAFLRFAETPLEGIQTTGVEIPVPASTPGCVLVLHLITGEQNTGVSSGGSMFGIVEVSGPADAAAIGNPNTLFETDTTAFYTSQGYAFDSINGTPTTLTVTAPNALDPRGFGVMNWVWTEVCDNSGAPFSTNDLLVGQSYQELWGGPRVAGTPSLMGPFPQDADCPTLAWTTTRHMLTNKVGEVQEIHDGVWSDYSLGDQIYQTSSCDSGPADPCCAGLSMALVPAGAGDFQHSFIHNIDGGAGRQWSVAHGMPIDCQVTACVGGESNMGEVTFNYTSPFCQRVGSKNVQASDIEFIVGAGSEVRLVPVINGVDVISQALVVNNTTGNAPLTTIRDLDFDVDLGTIPEDGTGNCTVDFRMDVIQGDGAGTTIKMPSGTVTTTLIGA